MSTNIDTLTIEIQSTSTGAAKGIDDLAIALEKLKQNGSIGVAVKNLKSLSDTLKGFTSVSSNANKVSQLAKSLGELKGVGSINIGSGIQNLVTGLKGLSGVQVDGLEPKIKGIADAMSHLSNVKAGGFASAVNGLAKLDKVTESLDDATITAFTERVKRLNDELGPLSEKMTTIRTGFGAINSGFRGTARAAREAAEGINESNLNFSTFANVIQTVVQGLQAAIEKFKKIIEQSIEWDGISSRFGRSFGPQAQETYEWLQRLNEEMGINIQQFMQYSSVNTSMLTGFGVAYEDAVKMGIGYTELTYDIWAGYNDIYKTFEEANEAVRSAIAGEVEPIRRAGFTIVEATLEQTAANHGLEISIHNATEEQKSYLRYLTLVDQAHAKSLVGTYAKELNTAEGLMRTLSQQVKSLAQAFGSLFLPILVKVLPYFQALVELLTQAVHWLAGLFGVEIQAVDWSSYNTGAEAIGSVADSADTATDSLGSAAKAAKELKNATLGIDELNVISPPSPKSGSGGSGGGGAGGGFDGLDVDSLWDESIFSGIQSDVDKIKSMLEESLSSITAVISGFALAIGTILVVTGANIPVGLGLMAVGAVGLVSTIAANWNGMSTQLAKTLTTVTSVLGGFMLAIGAFLAFSGVNVPLGAALMAAGAVSLATAATINWKFLEGDMRNTLSILTGIISGGLLAMGALFAFTGVDVPLGVALMAAGAIGLVTAVALNWDSLSAPVRTAIGTLEAVVGGALLTFGAILALTGANIPLGVGMIAAGAVSLVSAAVLNWDSLTGDTKTAIANIEAIVGGALLGIGAILAFTGVATPIGVAMIAAGAVSLVAAASVNWNYIYEKIKGVLEEVGIAVGVSLLAVGAILAFSGVGLPIGIGLMAAGAASLASGVALNWNTIKTKVKNAIDGIKDWIDRNGRLVLGVLLCLSGVGMGAGIALLADHFDGSSDGSIDGEALKTNMITGLSNAWTGVTNWWNSKPKLQEISANVSDVKTKLSNSWTKAKTWWNNSKGTMKEYTPNIGSIKDKVSSAWSSAKTWWSNSKGVMSTYTPSIGSIKDKVSSAWNTAKNWWNRNKGSLSYTPGIGSIKDKLVNAWNTAKNWWNNTRGGLSFTPTVGSIKDKLVNAWNTAKNWFNNQELKLKIKMPHISVSWNYDIADWQKTIAKFLFNKSALPKLSVSWYAQGGFPSTGELFMAREAGPEMVGRIGGRSAVANNEQIVEAISEGVYAAVVAAMGGSGGNGEQAINIYLDGKQITASVEKHQKERGASIMGTQIYSYA